MMKRVTYLTRSKKREREAADEKEPVGESDLIHWLPPELKMQILMKLPAKSVATFVFVSKLWSSIVRETDLTDRFISQSASRPGLLFSLGGFMEYRFLSCSQDEPSVGYSRTGNLLQHISRVSSPIRGLICGEQTTSNMLKVICNPSTGQCVNLPRVKSRARYPAEVTHFLGYEPVNDRYKVLSMTKTYDAVVSEEHQVFTLGDRRKSWRRVECKVPHYPVTRELCKDGILYYGALEKLDNYSDDDRYLVVTFDLTTEEFGVVKLPDSVSFRPFDLSRLVNYNGKIALANDSLNSDYELWVLQDIDRQEWSKLSLFIPVIDGEICFSCIGTVRTGEIVFQTCKYTTPFFLVYYDMKMKTSRRVDIEGVSGASHGWISAFLDHVESPMYLEKESRTRI